MISQDRQTLAFSRLSRSYMITDLSAHKQHARSAYGTIVGIKVILFENFVSVFIRKFRGMNCLPVFCSLASMNKYNEISQAFHTCNPVTKDTLKHLYRWVRDSFSLLAMMNFPYPARALGQLPGYPVNVSLALFPSQTTLWANGIVAIMFALACCLCWLKRWKCFRVWTDCWCISKIWIKDLSQIQSAIETV